MRGFACRGLDGGVLEVYALDERVGVLLGRASAPVGVLRGASCQCYCKEVSEEEQLTPELQLDEGERASVLASPSQKRRRSSRVPEEAGADLRDALCERLAKLAVDVELARLGVPDDRVLRRNGSARLALEGTARSRCGNLRSGRSRMEQQCSSTADPQRAAGS